MSQQWRNMPVVRRNGAPVSNNVRPTNRSELIRRIFNAKGNVPNSVIHDALVLSGGFYVSDALINTQRTRLFPDADE